MNDLFEQFSSQFEKPKEAPVASEPIVARNFKDNTIPVEETYSHMEFITGHKHFCDAYGYIIPKVYRDTYWEPNQVKKEVNYTHMPEGMKEAQTNNGVYDHVNGFPFAPVAITHTQPIAPDQQLPDIIAKETEFEIEGETDDKGQASLFDFDEPQINHPNPEAPKEESGFQYSEDPANSSFAFKRELLSQQDIEEKYINSPEEAAELQAQVDDVRSRYTTDEFASEKRKMSPMEYERQYLQHPPRDIESQSEVSKIQDEFEEIAENFIKETPMLSKALLQSEEVPPVFTAAIDPADKDSTPTVFLNGQVYELDENKRAIGYVPAFEGMLPEDIYAEFNKETPREAKVVPVIQIEGKDFIELVILGDPTAQKRHKHRHIPGTKFVQTYDPSEGDKADFLAIVQKNAPSAPLVGPLCLEIHCYFSRPKSHYRTGKNAHLLKDDAPEWHISKPDSDNLQKFIFDALNSIYWKDDSQICSVLFQKLYDVATPRTVIKIRRP